MYARVQSSDHPLTICGVLGKQSALSEPISSVVNGDNKPWDDEKVTHGKIR